MLGSLDGPVINTSHPQMWSPVPMHPKVTIAWTQSRHTFVYLVQTLGNLFHPGKHQLIIFRILWTQMWDVSIGFKFMWTLLTLHKPPPHLLTQLSRYFRSCTDFAGASVPLKVILFQMDLKGEPLRHNNYEKPLNWSFQWGFVYVHVCTSCWCMSQGEWSKPHTGDHTNPSRIKMKLKNHLQKYRCEGIC